MNVKMTNQEIQEKYGIEPIMKEMWVWDEYKSNAKIKFVSHKRIDNAQYPYQGIDKDGDCLYYTNASETNPNEKEPKVGDKGYFWDDEEVYLYDTLINIEKSIPKYDTADYGLFLHFSHEKQPWMR